MRALLLLALAVFTSRFDTARTSYLDVPRIHFKGKYRADANSRNNCQCNFDLNKTLNEGQESNYKGTGEWEFLDTHITSVINEKGKEISDSPLLGGQIFSNEEGPFAKAVDLDVDFQVTSLYGIKFCLKVNEVTVLRGDWAPAVVVRDMWNRLKCGDPNDDAKFGTISTSIITNIDCLSQSNKVPNLCKAWNTTELSVSISLGYFSGDVFTIGNVVGTIGIAKEGEPMNVGGERKLESTGEPIEVCPNAADPVNDGVNVAPFLYDENRQRLVVDIGNAFPADSQNQPIDLGTLWLGVLDDGAVSVFGEPLPYLNQYIWEHGGVVEYEVPKELKKKVESSPVVIVKEVDSNASGEHKIYPLKESFPSLKDSKAKVLLQESEYFVRPTGYYHERLEYRNDDYDTTQITLLVTKFGKPKGNILVRVEPRAAIPANGVVASDNSQHTNDEGLVTYTFKANRSIPLLRKYETHPCASDDCPNSTKNERITGTTHHTEEIYHMPIEGQVYHFCYFVDIEGTSASSCDDDIYFNKTVFSQVISFLSFSTVFYERPYAWVEHVMPIFKQVHHLHYIMRAPLDMSSFKDVTQPYNKILLKQALSKDINDAGYMPVTRDLSPTKKHMILEWLDRPCYTKLDCDTADKCKQPKTKSRLITEDQYQRCGQRKIPSKSNPQKYYSHIHQDEDFPTFNLRAEHPPRPLFGYGSEKEEAGGDKSFFWSWLSSLFGDDCIPLTDVCTVENLRGQLQLAVQIEFSTLPLYLTSLYTIMDDCNVEAYQLIRNMIVQEMLHFAQAANILIAIGGKVKIDSNDTVPQFPTTGLPGGVLPGLTLTLEKYTMKHVQENFMALEIPTDRNTHKNWTTIGEFYTEIQDCMETLLANGEKIFEKPHENKQVEWPWETPLDVGTLYKVTDMESANHAIEEIIEQGEGAREDNPVDESTKHYAHFFRFEEIFCEHKLVKLHGGGYAYKGDPIPYNPNGVWNMKANLTISDIKKGTVCHTQAKTFHEVYRTLLRVLQDTFDGHPERIGEAVKLMEVLKTHAKRVIWTPLESYTTRPPIDGEVMCGPIWDYEWKE